MDHASASFASPWAAAVLGSHANTEHAGFGHPLDLQNLHGYSYYRCEIEQHRRFFFHVFDTTPNFLFNIEVIYCDLCHMRSLKNSFVESQLTFQKIKEKMIKRIKFVYKISRSHFVDVSNQRWTFFVLHIKHRFT
jgi:hypothetical protein